MIKLLRGFFIAFLSAIIITFVIFIFSPLLPLNIFTDYMGVVLFLIVFSLSYIVYKFLPPEALSLNNSFQDTKTVHLEENENSQ